jgi:F0F1-type ATP synthase delta subunit
LAGSNNPSIGEAARRYAAAVFDLALDTGEVDAVEAGLSAWAGASVGQKALYLSLRAPLYTS